MIGFFIAEAKVGDLDHHRAWELVSTIYGASVLLCTGPTLLITFLIEYNLSRKEKK